MGNILFATHDDVHVLKFVGDVRVVLGPALSQFIKGMHQLEFQHSIVIDLTETISIDSTALGLLAKISLCSQESYGKLPTVFSTNPDVTRILISMGFDSIFIIVDEEITHAGELTELPRQLMSEPDLREQVLSAHKTLMKLNAKNKACFCDLVEALEKEQLTECSGIKSDPDAFESRKAG